MTEVTSGIPEATRVGWVDLFVRVRSGDRDAAEQLRAIVRKGVFTLIRRRASGIDQFAATNQAVETVLRQVTSGLIQSEQEYAVAARQAVIEAAGRRPVQPAAAGHRLHSLTDGLSDVEREMLRRYYVMREEPEQICSTLRVGLEDFTRARAVLRSRMG